MRSRSLSRTIVYLELTDSLLDGDGGEGRMLYRLGRDLPWLFKEGWRIERWGLRRSKRIPYTIEPSSLRGPTFPLPAFPRVLLPGVVWASQFAQALLRPRAGIFLAFSPITGTGAAAARSLRRRHPVLAIRIISDFSARTGALYGRRRELILVKALERFVLRRADLVLPMGPFTHQLATDAGVPEERIIELPNLPSWFGADVIPAELEDRPRIVCAGRLVPEKGFDVLLAAFADIAEEFPDALLDVAGDGPQGVNLQQQASSLGIADRVRFRGSMRAHAMPGFYRGGLIAVLPSRVREGLGMVLVEAGLAGCALVGTDFGGIRDIVHPDRTGILVPPNDREALAEALRTLLMDPDRARLLGAGAQAEASAYIGRRGEAVRRVQERIHALRTARP